MRRLALFLGTGAGTGYAPVAPGTFGTLPGVALAPLFAALAVYSVPVYLLALLAAVARLVVAVWTAADPLLVPGRELRGEIAADLDQIAPRSGEGLEAFRAEADRYR